jgi:hypothetical protein
MDLNSLHINQGKSKKAKGSVQDTSFRLYCPPSPYPFDRRENAQTITLVRSFLLVQCVNNAKTAPKRLCLTPAHWLLGLRKSAYRLCCFDAAPQIPEYGE